PLDSDTLSLHDALPIWRGARAVQRHGADPDPGAVDPGVDVARRRADRPARHDAVAGRYQSSGPPRRSLALLARPPQAGADDRRRDRKSTRLNSSHQIIS